MAWVRTHRVPAYIGGLSVSTLLGTAVACGSGSSGDGTPTAGAGAGGTAGSSAAVAGGGANSTGASAGGANSGGANSGGSVTASGGADVPANAGSSAAGAGGAPRATGGTPGNGGADGAGASKSGGGAMAAGGAADGGNASDGGSDGGSGGITSVDLGPSGADGFAIKAELASDIKSTAPTTVGIVRWSLADADLTEAHIDFGLDTTYGTTAPVDLTRTDYRTLLLGMKPAKTYHFRVVATDAAQTYTSDDRTLETGAPMLGLPITSFSIKSPGKVDKGFFISSFWFVNGSDKSQRQAFIMDSDGEIVWWYTDPNADINGIARARISADGEDMWLASVSNGGAPLHRVSMDTLEEQVYSNAIGSHDISAISGDRMAYLDYGEDDCASIFEIDKAGVTNEVFESTGITGTPGVTDPCHGNSVRYSKREDVYVFSDNFHDVLIVGRDGAVQWALSDAVSGGHASWGGFQHGTQLLDSSLLIYANEAGGGATVSQAIEFGLDGSVIKKFTSRGGGDFLGDVQRLPSGNTLIDYSFASSIQEVDASDAVVLEIKGGYPFGYLEFRESLYGVPLDIQQ